MEIRTIQINCINCQCLRQKWLRIIRGLVRGPSLSEKGFWNISNTHLWKDGSAIIIEWNWIFVSYHSVTGWHQISMPKHIFNTITHIHLPHISILRLEIINNLLGILSEYSPRISINQFWLWKFTVYIVKCCSHVAHSIILWMYCV